MSGEVSRLYILFDADGKPYVKGLKGLESQTHKSASTMEKRFASAGKTIGAAMGLSLAAVAAGVVGIGVGVVKSAASFEYEMDRVQAVSNATGGEMQQLSDLALQLGKDTVFSSGQAAQGLYSLATAGVSVADIMGGAGQAALALAAAGEIEVGRAAEIAAAAMNVFGLKGKDVMQVADALAGAAVKSAVEVSDLAEAFQQSASVAAQAGWTVQELTAAIAEMGNAGLRGGMAGDSFKQMLLQLEAPTDKAAKLMKEMGINLYDANNNMYDAETIIGILEKAFGPLDEAQYNYNANVIFGSNAIQAANVLIGKGAAAFDTMRDSVSQAGEAQRVAAAKMDNLKGSWEQLKGSAETLAISIGTKAIPKIREFVDEFTGAINQVLETGDWSQLGEQISTAIGGGMQAAAPVVAKGFALALKEGIKNAPLLFAEVTTAMLSTVIPVDKLNALTAGAENALSDFGRLIRDHAKKEGISVADSFAEALATGLKPNAIALNRWKFSGAEEQNLIAQQLGLSPADIDAAVRRLSDPDVVTKLAGALVEQRQAVMDRASLTTIQPLKGDFWGLPGDLEWKPGSDPGAMFKDMAAGAYAATGAQKNLGTVIRHTTEITQEQKDAWDQAGIKLNDYNSLTNQQIIGLDALAKKAGELAATLQGVADTTFDPSAIWKEADGSLKTYLKSLQTHQKALETFQTTLRKVATTYGANMGPDAPAILQKFIELGPDELAKMDKVGAKGYKAFIGGWRASLAFDAPAVTAELLDLAGVDMSPAGQDGASTYVDGFGNPILPTPTVPTAPLSTDATKGLAVYRTIWGAPTVTTPTVPTGPFAGAAIKGSAVFTNVWGSPAVPVAVQTSSAKSVWSAFKTAWGTRTIGIGVSIAYGGLGPHEGEGGGGHASRSAIVADALTGRGTPYVWGGTSQKTGWDCSGFVGNILSDFGIQHPRTARALQAYFPSAKSAKPGDLLFYGRPAYHVAMALGGGKQVEARGRAWGTGVWPVRNYSSIGRIPAYDKGGYLPPGISMAINKTGRGEPILTPTMGDDLRQIVAMLKPSMDTAGPVPAAKDNTPTLVRELRSVADRMEQALLTAEDRRIQHDHQKGGR